MKIALHEITDQQVIGLNKRAILDAHRKDPKCKQQHVLRNPGGLSSCLGSIFYQSGNSGYINAPLEKMAGLLLYRIAQGQFFLDGNKRTAVLSCVVFLWNNGHRLRVDEDKTNDLIWGFAQPTPPKYAEADSIQFIHDNIYPVI